MSREGIRKPYKQRRVGGGYISIFVFFVAIWKIDANADDLSRLRHGREERHSGQWNAFARRLCRMSICILQNDGIKARPTRRINQANRVTINNADLLLIIVTKANKAVVHGATIGWALRAASRGTTFSNSVPLQTMTSVPVLPRVSAAAGLSSPI